MRGGGPRKRIARDASKWQKTEAGSPHLRREQYGDRARYDPAGHDPIISDPTVS